jgi:hypothetical protein
MRAIYRLSPAEALALPAPEYFALVYRLPYYPGVIQAKAMPSEPSEPVRSTTSGEHARKVPGTYVAIMSDPELSSVISFSRVKHA